MMRQEIDQDVELDKMDYTSGNENLYREFIVNKGRQDRDYFISDGTMVNT